MTRIGFFGEFGGNRENSCYKTFQVFILANLTLLLV